MLDFYLEPENGLGDQFLDIIGITVMANLFSCKAHVVWGQRPKSSPFGTGIYDRKLYNFERLVNLIVYDTKSDFGKRCSSGMFNTIAILNPSATLSPYSVYTWINIHHPEMKIQIQDLIYMYKQVASLIGHTIPKDLLSKSDNFDDVIAIHVRCTDKDHDYQQIWQNILTMAKSERRFFICSEDEAMRTKMTNDIRNVNPVAEFVLVARPDAMDQDASKTYSVAIDLFTMSKCIQIHQCTNYSTFSILASLIGNTELVSYQLHTPTLLHSWMPCCVNGSMDINMKLSNPFAPLNFIKRKLNANATRPL
jgi:hypothetical protein